MNALRLISVSLFLFLATSFAGTKSEHAIRLAIIGDSTVKGYPDDSLVQGWGKYAGLYLKSSVVISNHANGGASSRSFMASEKWRKTLEERPEYILIQFGHNDAMTAGDVKPTVPETEFEDSLRAYIRETKAARAVPILITPMEMRMYSTDGKLKETLAPYANAMKAVAKEQKVGLVDLHAASCRLYESLGREGLEKFAAEPGDPIHFNDLGAREMAKLVMTDLVKQHPELKRPSDTVAQVGKKKNSRR